MDLEPTQPHGFQSANQDHEDQCGRDHVHVLLLYNTLSDSNDLWGNERNQPDLYMLPNKHIKKCNILAGFCHCQMTLKIYIKDMSHCTPHTFISMGWGNKDKTPLVMNWIYVYLALTHRFNSDQYVKYKNNPFKTIYDPVWINYGMMHAQTESMNPVFMYIF